VYPILLRLLPRHSGFLPKSLDRLGQRLGATLPPGVALQQLEMRHDPDKALAIAFVTAPDLATAERSLREGCTVLTSPGFPFETWTLTHCQADPMLSFPFDPEGLK